MLWSVGMAVIGYLSILGIFAICAAMCAPVRLDQQRVVEIEQQKKISESHMEARTSAEIMLQQESARKSPRDEHREQLVASVFREQDRGFLAWLLHTGRSEYRDISTAGFGATAEDVRSYTATIHLVDREILYSTNGVVEKGRYYQINPKFEVALTNLLHPPRPVTPPPA